MTASRDDTPRRRAVVVESPFRGAPRKIAENYARRAMRDALRRGEAPFLSHLLYTQVLDDDEPEDRELGIASGLELGLRLDAVAFYLDLGISAGMNRALRFWISRSKIVEFRVFEGADLARTLHWSEARAISPTIAEILKFHAADH